MKKTLCIVAAVSALSLCSCGSDNPELSGNEPGNESGKSENQNKEITLTAAEKEANECQNNFSFRFLEEAEKNIDGNIFISPISLSMYLSTISNGAIGESKTQIITALGCDADNIESLNDLNIKLLKELPAADTETTVEISNSIWSDVSFSVKQSFIDKSIETCQAEFRNIDLFSYQSVTAINSWCSEKTHGLVTGIIQCPPSIDIAFYNATYFNGKWKYRFDKENTEREIFTNSDGSVSTVDMMNQVATYEYSEYDGIKLIKIPYGNGSYTMNCAMADNGTSAGSILNAFTNAEFKTTKVVLKMPRLDATNLIAPNIISQLLKSMGVTNIFDSGKADFSAISDKATVASVPTQVVVFKVDEQGTEAAAVTGVVTGLTPQQTESFHMDKPFTFFIQENSTGAILFMGKVNKP